MWDALFDEDAQKEYKELLKDITKDLTPYLFRDVLEAVEKCAEAVALQAEHKSNISNMLEKVDLDPYLEDTVKGNFVENLNIFAMGYPDMDFITLLLEAVAAYPEDGIRTDVFDEALEGMKKQNLEMENLSDLLDVTDSWQNINEQLAEYTGEQDEAMIAMVEQARATAEALKADIEDFFALALNDPEKQAALDEQIEKLEQYVEAFPTLLTILSSPYEQQQEEQIAQLQQQIEEMKEQMALMQEDLAGTDSKSVFGFIALGVAVLAVIMGIIAAVCALKKKGDEGTENLQAAVRKDLEAVEAQNDILKCRMNLLFSKLDEMKEPQPIDFAQLQALERSVEDNRKDIDEIKRSLNPIPGPKPGPGPDPDSVPPVVARLRLSYQSVNPKNSYLYVHDNGEYNLHSDNTVSLRESELHKVNELRGWRDNGLLHMFRPEIDGKVLENYENLPTGYFEAAAVKTRASVKRAGESTYTLLQKGGIVMKR